MAFRERRPNGALAEALTKLEPGAAGTALYRSGLAAITTSFSRSYRPATSCSSRQCLRTDAEILRDVPEAVQIETRYYDPMWSPDRGNHWSQSPRDPSRESGLTYDGSA